MFETASNLPEENTSDSWDGTFRNIEEQSAYEEYEKMLSFYPLFNILGDTISYILILICFGILGSLIRLLLMSLMNKTKIDELDVFSTPALGGILGLLTLVVGELLPDFKYQSGNDKFYYTMAILGGIYTEEFFQWLEFRFRELLGSNNKDENSSSE